MTDEQMRIAIAEACNISDEEIQRWGDYEKAERQFQCAEISSDEYYRRHLRVEPVPKLPDYPNDLNAMHIVEGTMDLDQSLIYDKFLAELTDSFAWHATARQRAEAFLRTIGRWTE